MRFPRATRLIVLVKSAKAAQRVMDSLIGYCEGRLKLVVNRAKSRATKLLMTCTYPGIPDWPWGQPAMDRQRPCNASRSECGTSPDATGGTACRTSSTNCGRYVLGWLNYYKLSATYTAVLELSGVGQAKGEAILLEAMEAMEAMEAAPNSAAPSTGVWEMFPDRRCTWRRGAGKATGG